MIYLRVQQVLLLPPLLLLLLLPGTGCSIFTRQAQLPEKCELARERLRIHSDFYMPRHHRLIESVVQLEQDVTQTLGLPKSDEPIDVYLFENEKRFRSYLKQRLHSFPDRRAFFIKTDTQLMVLAYWGDKLSKDLRHEITHGYLHSVVPAIPLWLDEGLAEYFEVQPSPAMVNEPHLQLLAEAYARNQWQPDLTKLESLRTNVDLTQLQYAEAWLWVHFLLRTDAHTNHLICQTLKQLRETGAAEPLAPQLESWMPELKQNLLAHLKRLSEEAAAD